MTASTTIAMPTKVVPRQTSTVEGTKPEAAPTPVEAASAETVETKPDALSPKFAALAKREKAVREATRAFQAEKAKLQEQLKEIETAKAWRESLTKNPMQVLQEAGISYDQLTQIMLNQPPQGDPELAKIQRELELVKASQEQERQRAENHQKSQYEQAKKQMAIDAKTYIASNPEFEAIANGGDEAIEAMVALIEHDFNEKGSIPSIEAVAKEIEDALVEEEFNRVQRAMNLKKIQARLAPPAPPAEVEQTQAPKAQSPQIQTTLSNRMVQSTTKPSTAAERKARAIAAFLGQNK
jgi:hypothetical protein